MGEDWVRFVEHLANRLRQNGIDAWGAWELKDGDKLVERIFEHGLGEADAVIVVLSPASVAEPWVRKEVDVAGVRQIEDLVRLIPVVQRQLP